MVNSSPEMSPINLAPPPPGFVIQNAWEIRERIPKKIHMKIPSIPPKVDRATKYSEVQSENPRYIVEEKPFNHGGIGDIYRGWDPRLNRYVAVKRLNREYADEKECHDILELEAKTLAKLHHPGIPEVFDLSSVTNPNGTKSPLIIMQYIDAPNLQDRMNSKTESPLPIEEVGIIISQSGEVIDYLHKNGLIHTDIKPKNILYDLLFTKIIDPGSSNWVEPKSEDYSFGYSAPEIINKQSRINPLSDIYSLAATAHTIMFKSVPPFCYNESFYDSFIKSKNASVYAMSGSIQQELYEVLKKGMAYYPEERYQTAKEFTQDFCKVIAKI